MDEGSEGSRHSFMSLIQQNPERAPRQGRPSRIELKLPSNSSNNGSDKSWSLVPFTPQNTAEILADKFGFSFVGHLELKRMSNNLFTNLPHMFSFHLLKSYFPVYLILFVPVGHLKLELFKKHLCSK